MKVASELESSRSSLSGEVPRDRRWADVSDLCIGSARKGGTQHQYDHQTQSHQLLQSCQAHLNHTVAVGSLSLLATPALPPQRSPCGDVAPKSITANVCCPGEASQVPRYLWRTCLRPPVTSSLFLGVGTRR
ncbi:hypothetical protein DL93DRAFT_1177644 [Clavulina sp. PMI_390]|nr:hypothetical protein DL93DRAFT_1177644 [Clavulina sp. PMI_390]